MLQSTAVRIVPATKPDAAENDSLQATAQLLAQAWRISAWPKASNTPCGRPDTGRGCIEIAVQSPVVVLRGLVPSYYLKQVAQTAVQAVPIKSATIWTWVSGPTRVTCHFFVRNPNKPGRRANV